MADTGRPATAGFKSTAAATRGIHHLALTTEDMQKTTDFYVNIVGMPLVHAMKVPPGLGTGPGNRGNPPYENIRHYFFDMGNDSLLAFFEIPKGAQQQTDRDDIGGLQHCAFAVTVERFADIQRRLEARGVPFDGPLDILPGLKSIYFYDPNGIRLEACCEPAAGERPGVIMSVLQTKDEARAELASTGADRAWVEKTIANLPDARA